MDYDRIWDDENDAGRGYAVGDESDDINEIDGLGRLIEASDRVGRVAVYRADSGAITIVGDAWGPWAVDGPASLCAPSPALVAAHVLSDMNSYERHLTHATIKEVEDAEPAGCDCAPEGRCEVCDPESFARPDDHGAPVVVNGPASRQSWRCASRPRGHAHRTPSHGYFCDSWSDNDAAGDAS